MPCFSGSADRRIARRLRRDGAGPGPGTSLGTGQFYTVLPGWRHIGNIVEITGFPPPLPQRRGHGFQGAGPVHQPLCVVVDSRWRIPPGSRVLREPERAWVVGGERNAATDALEATGVRCTSLPGADGRVDPVRLLDALGDAELNEVQVEAGSRLCGALLQAGLVDEILLYLAPVLLGDGGPGPFAFGPLESMQGRTHLKRVDITHLGRDLRMRLVPEPSRTPGAAPDTDSTH